ncbi:hypothetical protein [Propionivibrio sp.]|uniref:hypothetical protein n=1 Tax=Propionivibrio sp. TaxID=2212460 RepID=UPI003BF1B90A
MIPDDETPNRVKPVMPKDDLQVQAMFAAMVSQHQEIESLKRKLKTSRANGRYLKSQLDRSEGFNDMTKLLNPGILWPIGMLAKLIRLAHPDKHGGSETATMATAWLLSQRP